MELKRFIPLLVLLALMALAYLSGASSYLTFEQLKAHRETLLSFTSLHPWLSLFTYIGAYTLIVALSLPGAVYMSVLGGFLFPQPWATLYIVLSATTGALFVFLAARTAFQEVLRRKAGPLLLKLEAGFQQDAAHYLLFLRLVPLFPFWLVNLAAAFFGVRLLTFFWTTCIGIIPGSFVFAQAGEGLGAILDSGATFTLQGLFNPQMRLALLALALFALIPVALRHLRR